MVILIAGSTHSGKTYLARRLVQKYGFFCISIDHIKMGLIRSGICPLSPESSDSDLTPYLWNIVKEIVKTAIENKQHIIIEGCYIPFDFAEYFSSDYLPYIKYICIVLSCEYIANNFNIIKEHANAAEKRLDDSYCTKELLLKENSHNLEMCRKYSLNHILITNNYISDLEKALKNLNITV